MISIGLSNTHNWPKNEWLLLAFIPFLLVMVLDGCRKSNKKEEEEEEDRDVSHSNTMWSLPLLSPLPITLLRPTISLIIHLPPPPLLINRSCMGKYFHDHITSSYHGACKKVKCMTCTRIIPYERWKPFVSEVR